MLTAIPPVCVTFPTLTLRREKESYRRRHKHRILINVWISLPKPKVPRFPKCSGSAPKVDAQRHPREWRGSSFPPGSWRCGESHSGRRGGAAPREFPQRELGLLNQAPVTKTGAWSGRNCLCQVPGGIKSESNISPTLQEFNTYLDRFKQVYKILYSKPQYKYFKEL